MSSMFYHVEVYSIKDNQWPTEKRYLVWYHDKWRIAYWDNNKKKFYNNKGAYIKAHIWVMFPKTPMDKIQKHDKRKKS